MRMALLGAIATSIVVTIGTVIALGPTLMHTLAANEPPPVMMSFSIVDGGNAPEWCTNLASVLEEHDVKATVFVTGEVAEQHPKCVTDFASQGTDVGSQTYGYANLNAISDYTVALEEVRKGKEAVDKAGNIKSHAFKAPLGETNQDIYSLLSSSDITADFSYTTQYNKYEGDKFVKYDLVSCDCRDEPEKIEQLAEQDLPIIINIDNNTQVSQIEDLIVSLKEREMNLVSASDLTELDLTVEGAQA